jgi:hypothetical protein
MKKWEVRPGDNFAHVFVVDDELGFPIKISLCGLRAAFCLDDIKEVGRILHCQDCGKIIQREMEVNI